MPFFPLYGNAFVLPGPMPNLASICDQLASIPTLPLGVALAADLALAFGTATPLTLALATATSTFATSGCFFFFLCFFGGSVLVASVLVTLFCFLSFLSLLCDLRFFRFFY